MSTMVIPQGKSSRKSWNMPVIVNSSGKNVIEMASVAVRIDLKKWFALWMLACHRGMPSARSSI